MTITDAAVVAASEALRKAGWPVPVTALRPALTAAAEAQGLSAQQPAHQVGAGDGRTHIVSPADHDAAIRRLEAREDELTRRIGVLYDRVVALEAAQQPAGERRWVSMVPIIVDDQCHVVGVASDGTAWMSNPGEECGWTQMAPPPAPEATP